MQAGHVTRTPALLVAGAVIALLGAVLVAGGVWLITLGGSWYYLIAGASFLLTAFFLVTGATTALWIYAAVVAGTMGWALWEVGFDWWALAPRGGVIFLIGLFLLTPGVTRALDRSRRTDRLDSRPDAAPPQVSAFRGAGLPLTAALCAALVVAVTSWFIDPHQIEGSVQEAPAGTAVGAQDVPPGEWHAYGRTGYGQRYSPLTQITPANAAKLDVAWTYHTGDMRGRPGDPTETTFQVTPLKIGNRLFLCTPHQSVIALDATTGAEIWRYDPKILNKLALQHLTCRGLSYYPGSAGSGAAAMPRAAGPADAALSTAAKSAIPDLPVAAANADKTADCAAKLFMPTADGRLIALNPLDGAVCGKFGGGTGQINLWANMPNVMPGGYYSTSPVVVVRNLIIVGGTVLDNVTTTEPSGVIRALDVETGQLIWNWDPANPEQTAPIADGETYTPSSPNSWSISSVDEALGLVYVPLGNQPPDQWGG